MSMGELKDTVKDGWAFPMNSKKAHYFIDKQSICRKWMFLGTIFADEQSSSHSTNDCKACRKKLSSKGKQQ